MADFCKQCSINNWGEDTGDLAGLTLPDSWAKQYANYAWCEGCGPIQVDPEGNCVSKKCLEAGKPGHGLPWVGEDEPQEQPKDADRSSVVSWAVERWRAEVASRPIENIHRAAMDRTWRQVIRHYGGDDIALLGPEHSTLAAQHVTRPRSPRAELSGSNNNPASEEDELIREDAERFRFLASATLRRMLGIQDGNLEAIRNAIDRFREGGTEP